MNWLYYLLEANLYLAVFYGFYRLFLHLETFYSLNRYYLITATIVSFILPLLQVGYLNTIFASSQETTMMVTSVVYQKRALATDHGYLELPSLLYGTYLVITSGFLLKMLFTLVRIFSIYFKSKRQKIDSITLIELKGQHAAFSFFNMLFIDPDLNQKDTVLKHEMVHVKQNHSADVLFFEIVQIISWFNPVVYFLKRDIKLLHEYLADEQTTAAGIQKHDYALFLIQHSFGPISNTLSNQIFNESLLKRRIKMLNKQKSGGLAKFRLLLLVPVATCLLCASTMAFTKDYVLVDLFPQQTTTLRQDTSLRGRVFISHKVDKSAKVKKSTEKRAVVVNGRVILDEKSNKVTVVEMQPPATVPAVPKVQPAADQASVPQPKTITVRIKQPAPAEKLTLAEVREPAAKTATATQTLKIKAVAAKPISGNYIFVADPATTAALPKEIDKIIRIIVDQERKAAQAKQGDSTSTFSTSAFPPPAKN